MIDPHVHLRDWNQKDKETMLHGLLVAVSAHIDTVFDMPNTSPVLTDRETVLRRLEEGEKAAEEVERRTGTRPHYHVYCGLTSDERQMEEMVALHRELFPRVCGLKLFASQSTGNMGIIGKENQKRIWQKLTQLEYKGVVAVHAEKEELFQKDTTDHTLIRWSGSEVGSVLDQLECVEKVGFQGTLHIAHISTKGALEAVMDAKRRGLNVTCGVTPHHALLNRSEGYSFLRKMNPPLRDEEDRKAVYDGLFSGAIDWIESDHAPHTLSDKEKNASGIPGFEGMARLVSALQRDGMTKERLEGLTGGNILRAFGFEAPTSLPPLSYTKEEMESLHQAYSFSAW